METRMGTSEAPGAPRRARATVVALGMLGLACASGAYVALRARADPSPASQTPPPPRAPPPEPTSPGSPTFARAPSEPAPPPVATVGGCPLGEADADGTTPLARALRDALEATHFDRVIDLASPPAGDASIARARPPRIAHRPSADVAVIAFPEGCPPAFASVMTSREIDGVRINRVDPETLGVKGVRLRRWDQARWDALDAPPPPFTEDDDVQPAEPDAGATAAADFTVPYPASVFKLLVAVRILELSDRGLLDLSDRIGLGRRTRTVREWMADMITVSDDESTRALVKGLHEIGGEAALNALFAGLGLSALQMHDTSPETGRNWQPGRIHMSAWDTARLLWLLDPDAPPPTWTAPGGAPVDTGFLRPESRRLLVELLGAQAFHDALSTTALCRVPKTRKGIPALMPERWIDLEGRPGVAIGRGLTDRLLDGGAPSSDEQGADVRQCNREAEVTFAHKTGLTENFASDVGIVRGIPGRARRHYIVSFFSNLGYRYTDADKASSADPCHELGICYTQRIAGLGAAIDAAMRASLEPRTAGTDAGPEERRPRSKGLRP
jgi:hypothetical protein